MSFKIFISLVLLSSFILNPISAQDILKDKNGNEYNGRILKKSRNGIYFQQGGSIPKSESFIRNLKLTNVFLNLSVGPQGASIPVGNFSKADPIKSTNKAGYAGLGSFQTIEAGVLLNKKFGFSFLIGQQKNQFKRADFDKFNFKYDDYSNIVNSYGSVFENTLELTLDANNFNSENKNEWKFRYYFIGPYYSFKMSKRFSLDLKVKVGIVNAMNSNLTMYYTDPTPNPFYIFNYLGVKYVPIKKVIPAYNLSLSYNYRIVKGLKLNLTIDYIRSRNIDFKSIYLRYYPQTSYMAYFENYGIAKTVNLSSVNLSLGVSYFFETKSKK